MNPVIERCVADAGNLSQAFGLGRVPGRIYAYLYFSHEPRGLAELQSALKISKGSASMCVRQLKQWGAVSNVRAKGDRRDYYRANDWFGKVLKNVLTEVIAARFADRAHFHAALDRDLARQGDTAEARFIHERLAHIRMFEDKAGKMWNNPLLQHFLR